MTQDLTHIAKDVARRSKRPYREVLADMQAAVAWIYQHRIDRYEEEMQSRIDKCKEALQEFKPTGTGLEKGAKRRRKKWSVN